MKLREQDEVEATSDPRPAYEHPAITVMTQEEVLAAFQVTNAGVTWWVM